MTTPSDRELRVLKRSFFSIKAEIDQLLLQKKVNIDVFIQVETLFEGNLKPDMDKYNQAAMDFFLLIDENSEHDLELEKTVLKDQAEVRKAFSLLQAKIKKISAELKGLEMKKSIAPTANSTLLEPFKVSSEQPKLKKIEIPEFDGDLSKFYNFKALFVNLVHNNSEFSNVQKLFYLKQALVGKAAIVLQDCDLADDAYPEAWSYFLDRYESKRAIVRNFFLKLSNLQPIKSEVGIRDILDQTMAIIRGLKVAGETVNETFSRYIAFIITSKLDITTAKDWENHTCTNSTYPKFEDLFKFLQGRTFVIDERRLEKPKEAKDYLKPPSLLKKAFASSSTKVSCPLCQNHHFLNQCAQFKALSAHRRYDFVKLNHLCLCCFSKEHSASLCTSNTKCRCGKQHHYMLHFEFKNSLSDAASKTEGVVVKKDVTEGENSNRDSASRKVFTAVSSSQNVSEKIVLLPSAIVRFACGKITGTIRVLLDNCSQATLISDRLVKKFHIPVNTLHHGSLIGGVTPGTVSANQIADLCLISRTQYFSIDVIAEVVPPGSMSYEVHTLMEKQEMNQLSKFQLADPALTKKPVQITDVDMIIGAEYCEKCLCNVTKHVNNLTLRLSKFGWLVSGPLEQVESGLKKFTGFTLKSIESDLKKYHQMESSNEATNGPNIETQSCVRHFESTYQVSGDGKFNLFLPFKVEKSKIANNRHLALKSLFRLEKTLSLELKNKYINFMREYIAMGHASLTCPIQGPCYYIPHRAVVREDSLTTPVRVVFNASSKLRSEISLNDALRIGPQIQRELFDILISVRTYCYVFSADVEKMYRMIWIDEQDRDMQRILWRESPEEPIREYKLNTVTYGTAPASFMATQCLEMIAREIETTYPNAAQIIRENFYMDDLIDGGDDLNKVCKNREIIHNALAMHGFLLRKYCANSCKIVSEIQTNLVLNKSNVELAENATILGVVWSPDTDNFCIKLSLCWRDTGVKVTKRLMMSYLARTFDPLGLIAPVCLRGKMMIQMLWQEGLDWDVSVSREIAQNFSEYLLDLGKLESFVVPRYVCHPNSRIQLIGFCDASTKAYSAVLYVRSIIDNTVQSCKLICCKTRIAPVKELTIPKLELSSALLLAQLVDRVRRNLNVILEDCFLFTDATVVLCWLSHTPEDWKTFVSNRVEKIQALIPYIHWFYVHTSNNPADLATRGLSVNEFLNSDTWLNGPKFLKNFEILSNPIPNVDVSSVLEKRKQKVFSINRVINYDNFIDRFSSYPRMLRVLAYVIRFINHTRKYKVSTNLFVSSAELDNSLIFAIRITQNFHFFDDVNRLLSNIALKANSKLLPLTPFLDENRILRVGGRLRHSNLSHAKKYPIILQAKAFFTKSMLQWIHVRYFHASNRFLLGYLASKYWIVGGCSNLVKSVVHGCVRCVRYRGKTMSQLMGQLPPFRVNVSRPFSHTGVDLAGPFECKCVAHRTMRYYKIYIAIFVCMTIKCVHMEIVTDLSTAKFIEAMQQFIGRRGVPSHIYSDNGTNFVGTRNLIVSNRAEVEAFAASEGIVWSMIPPGSPHFGGIWESAVRSAKYHFTRINAGNVLSYDEYNTLITRVEAVLNSRPLCLSLNQGEDVLTPGHFLIGNSLISLPEFEILDSSKSLSKRLTEVNNRLHSFWNSWKADYLNQLQRRYKWQREEPNIQVGQVVLLKDVSPPYKWPMAKIIKTYPDIEGKVRVVDLKVAGSQMVLKRPIVKLILLPINVTSEPLKGSAGGVCLKNS